MFKSRLVYILAAVLILAVALASCNTVQNVYDQVQETIDAEAALTPENAPTQAGTSEETGQSIEVSAPDPNFINSVGACRVKTDPIFSYPYASDSDWSIGVDDPAVTIIVYSDLQCPYCGLMDPEINTLFEAHKDETRMVFRQFPLDYHANAQVAAQSAEVVGEALGNEKFFEYISSMFAAQAEWQELDADDFLAYLQLKVENEYGLDPAEFTERLESDEIAARVEEDFNNGAGFVSGTPFVLMNGIPLMYFPSTIASFEDAYQFAKEFPNLVYDECPEMTIDIEKQYLAAVETTKGTFVIELYPKSAPYTVNSFIYLVNQGYFDNSPFHRVIADFVAQVGTGITGEIGPGYEFDNEIDPNLSYDKAGVVGMANRGEGTNTSQFFITYTPQPTLDGSYTIFGQVIEGMPVVESLQQVNPQTDTEPVEPDYIVKITIVEK
jgi:cyclophilin family peptidyl-prolyl cis-trans isomerase/protein-disulfide isomerase